MKTIGIIAGAGPEAGIDLFMKIVGERRRELGGTMADTEAPSIVVFSIPKLGLAMDIKNRHEEIWVALKDTYEKLAVHAELICIACNVLHTFVDRLRALQLDAEIISIVETVERYVRKEKLVSVGLLSISAVMDLNAASPYSNLKTLCKVVTPQTPEIMDGLIRDIKMLGVNRSQLHEVLENEIRKLQVGHVILACTELPLVSRPVPSVYQVDATLLLAQELISRAK